MFRKLCKYEFKSIARTLVPIYLAVIAVSIINAFIGFDSLLDSQIQLLMDSGFLRAVIGIIRSVSILAYFGVMVALFVLTLMVIIQRFYKGLLCDEGYLMFTLPVKPRQLIAAKGLTAFVMSILSTIVGGISVLILMLGAMGPMTFFSNIGPALSALFRQLSIAVPLWPLFALEFLVLMVVSGIASLYQIYLSMALGHLSYKHRVMMSVVAYIVVSTVLSLVTGIAFLILAQLPFVQALALNEEASMHVMMLGSLAVSAVQLVLFFFGTEHILSKKLNLE